MGSAARAAGETIIENELLMALLRSPPQAGETAIAIDSNRIRSVARLRRVKQ